MARSERVRQALACLQRGDWEGAHELIAEDPSDEAAWLHAHLHRLEGDLSNARYWYRRAGRPEATGALATERAELLAALEWTDDRTRPTPA